jgi:uncharacterized delta-60 repeat protein
MPNTGELDKTFNEPYGYGVSYSEPPGGFDPDSDLGMAIAIQPDGKIVAAGFKFPLAGANCFEVMRFDDQGDLDQGFGNGGVSYADFEANDRAFAVALQPDGKMVLAGSSNRQSPLSMDFAVARFLPTGELDAGFGDGGMTITSFGPQSISRAQGVAIEPNGRIVLAGYMYPHPMMHSRFALTRYGPNGALDHSFGQQGRVTTDFAPSPWGSRGNAVVIQPNGRIVVAGAGKDAQGYGFALAGYSPHDGSLDHTFGQQGRLVIEMGVGSVATSLAVTKTGGLAVGGGGEGRTGHAMAVARCLENGSLDNIFGGNGRAFANIPGYASVGNAVAFAHDEEVVVAGQAWVVTPHPRFEPALAEFDKHGKLVPFLANQTGGPLPPPGVTRIGPPPPWNWAGPTWPFGPTQGVAISGKKIVTVGWADNGSGAYQGFSVARFH